MYSFEVYKDRSGEWRWRFVAPNRKTMGDSGEGYVNKNDCLSAIQTIKREAPTAEVREV